MRRLAALLLAIAVVMPATAEETKRHTILREESGGIVPRYLLVDPNGRSVTSEDFRGKFQLIAFGYTYCPDVCPTTLVEMAGILQQLGEKGERLQPIFITVDPERDSGKVLKTYTEFFHPRILGLTGPQALVRRAADNFKVRYSKVREPGDPPDRYAMDHSAGMFLLAPDGTFIKKFAFASKPEAMAAEIGELMGLH